MHFAARHSTRTLGFARSAGLLIQLRQPAAVLMRQPAATNFMRQAAATTFIPQNAQGRRSLTTYLTSKLRTKPDTFSRGPQTVITLRGQQTRGARWENYTKANYGSNRGNRYRNTDYRKPFFERLTPETTVYTLIAINGGVFLLWQTAEARQKSFGDTKLAQWMLQNFTTMWANLSEGRVWTLVTPAFSHVNTMHLLVNMFVLHSFGPDLARMLGNGRFLAFYLGAAVCGNLLSTVLRASLPPKPGQRDPRTVPALGASTSVMGIATLFACLFPQTKFLIFLVVPVPAWLATAGFITWDLWGVAKNRNSRTDGAGHLGGAAAGLAYYWFRLRPLIRRMR
ncbi:hypothetical protein IW150_004893 [Coemansia sp. RSA 2607]|nr:hypothetical protein IW150_004893 [Coemansia sp. RSA 2607]